MIGDSFWKDIYIIKMADATDWITKYFIEDSFSPEENFSLFSVMIEQKERVLISNATQITNQEFLIIHITGVTKSAVNMIGIVEILQS